MVAGRRKSAAPFSSDVRQQPMQPLSHGVVFGLTLYLVWMIAYALAPATLEKFLVESGKSRFVFFRLNATARLRAVVVPSLLYAFGTIFIDGEMSYIATALAAVLLGTVLTVVERLGEQFAEPRYSSESVRWTDYAATVAYVTLLVLVPVYPFAAMWLSKGITA